jgi:spore coat polysaccharide biosynthesis predicted glycosyltransferase SpsG
MFAICLEASHQKGMGHLFRMLNFVKYLEQKKQDFIFLINDNEKTKDILEKHNYKYEIVDLNNFSQNWETALIKKYDLKYWINDRLDTNEKHIKNIQKNSIKVINFDDLGSGAKYSDINICGLTFNNKNIKGKKVLKGVDYLILNSQINFYKKQRYNLENILVTLGGSDTYAVTIKVLKLLKKYSIKATIHVGPSFKHKEELQKELTTNFKIVDFVPSLIEEFSKYDLAITGGGISPFEANASGLPCMIIANETFEVPNGEFLSSLGSSLYLGFHENIDESKFQDIEKLNLENMSQNGLLKLNTKAVEKIYKEIIDE